MATVAPVAPEIDASRSRFPSARPAQRAVAVWIFTCAAMVLAMVVVGGVTRLTRSGLSIVEWKPVTGALPPMSPEAWQQEFAKYQASPEYQFVNHEMTIDGFKSIFLVEWFHRLLGRLVGVVTFVPLVVFAARRKISKVRAMQLTGMFALGALQGALGWFMVKSGLVDVPRVSPYRLTAHLSMALAIFAGLLWAALDEVRGERVIARAPLDARRLAGALVAMAAVTIAWGGLMAGLHAGHVAPTFPTMNGEWIPSGLAGASPSWSTPFENAVAVHFLHRMLAYATAIVAIAAGVVAFRRTSFSGARIAAIGLFVVVGLQIALGAFTVLQHVPVWLAAWHQGNGALLLGFAVALLHALRGAPATSEHA
jgi:cytochrome c oxidase assembly protein subunit 15